MLWLASRCVGVGVVFWGWLDLGVCCCDKRCDAGIDSVPLWVWELLTLLDSMRWTARGRNRAAAVTCSVAALLPPPHPLP